MHLKKTVKNLIGILLVAAMLAVLSPGGFPVLAEGTAKPAATADPKLGAQLYHVTDNDGALRAQELPVSESGSVVTAQTDGFSCYTVEFTYDAMTCVLPGGSSVPLADILSAVGLSGDVSAVACSDESLFSAVQADGVWTVTLHRAFTSTEWMDVEINGVSYRITVTDAITAGDWLGVPWTFDDETGALTVGDGGAYVISCSYTAASDYPWNSFRADIVTVSFTGNIAVSDNLTSMFEDCSSLTGVSGLGNLHSGDVSDMAGMFANCSSLTSLDISALDTENVTNASYMFYDCPLLTTLTTGAFNALNNAEGMFWYCGSLTSLDLSGFTMTGATSDHMLDQTDSLDTLILGTDNVLTGAGLSYYWSTDLSSYVDSADLMAAPAAGTYQRVFVVGFEPGTGIGTMPEEIFLYSERPTNYIIPEPGGTIAATDGNVFWRWSYPIMDGEDYRFPGDEFDLTNQSSGLWLTAEYTAAQLYDGVPWRIEGTTLLIGDYNKTYSYVDHPGRGYTDWPWYSQREDITAVRFLGTVNGTGGHTGMFFGVKAASFDVGGFRTDNVTSLSMLFAYCSSMTSLDLSGWNVASVTKLNSMFENCTSLTTLNLSGWDLSSAADLSSLFSNCSSLTSLNLSGWNTAAATEMYFMFENCSSLTTLDLSDLDTGTVTDFIGMFSGCTSLASLDLSAFNTSSAEYLSSMFSGCTSLTSLDLSGFDTTLVTSAEGMFKNCSALTSLTFPGLGGTNLTNTDEMFYGCSALTAVDLAGADVSHVTQGAGMFSGCSALTSLDVSGFVMTGFYSTVDFLAGLDSLKELTLGDSSVLEYTGFDAPGHWSQNLTDIYTAAELVENFDNTTMAGTYKCVYVASFDANGGSGTMARQSAYYDTPVLNLPDCSFTAPDGYLFQTWDLGDPGEGVILTGDTTVSAQWHHVYNAPTWTWAEDASAATATFTCQNDPDELYTQTLDASVTIATLTAATCEEAGTVRGTGTVTLEGTDYTDSHDAPTPALGHDWGEPSYTWAEGNGVVNAERVCANDASHVDTESRATSSVTIEATCTEPGTTIYTATFTNAAFAEQSKTVEDSPALGHDWGEPSYTWADDNSTVTATRVCERDASHVETETVAASAEVTTAATCTEAGTTRYTAVFTDAAFAAQEKTLDDIPALGHDWGEPSYTWADDNSSVTASRVCANDTSHVETETAAASAAVTRAAICTEAGTTTYTATFTNPAFASQEKAIDNIPPLGHDWGEPSYTWADDNSTVTAARVCANDASHVETETVAASAAAVKAATCTEAGTTRYTASFTNAAFASQEKTLDDIPALGHDWGEPTYTWAEDNGSVTATRVCANDASHVETETVLTAVEEVKPTCTAKGELRYAAVFTNADFAAQYKKISDIPALGHRLQLHEAVDATCTETGSIEYWECADCGAFFADARGAEEITDHDSVITPALGHDYRAAWDKDATGHWHICTRCHQKDFVRPHTADYFPTVEAPSLCSECGYEIDPKLLIQSHAYFGSTGDLDITTVTFTKTKILDDDWIVLLPEQVPKRDGYYFEGWLCSSDIRTHAPGTTLPFTYAQCKSVIVRGLWTEVIGEGNHTLGAGVRYRFDEGSFMIAGDGSVYGGEQAFYSSYSGSLNVMKAG